MPNQQASVWGDYTWHSGVLDGFGIGAGARYTGNTYGDQANTWLAEGKADAFAQAMAAETGASGIWAGFNVHLAADMLLEAAAITTQINGEVIDQCIFVGKLCAGIIQMLFKLGRL